MAARDVRKLVEGSEVVVLGASQTFDVEEGAFVFEGQVEGEGNMTLGRGNFVTRPHTVKSLSSITMLLNFP